MYTRILEFRLPMTRQFCVFYVHRWSNGYNNNNNNNNINQGQVASSFPKIIPTSSILLLSKMPSCTINNRLNNNNNYIINKNATCPHMCNMSLIFSHFLHFYFLTNNSSKIVTLSERYHYKLGKCLFQLNGNSPGTRKVVKFR